MSITKKKTPTAPSQIVYYNAPLCAVYASPEEARRSLLAAEFATHALSLKDEVAITGFHILFRSGGCPDGEAKIGNAKLNKFLSLAHAARKKSDYTCKTLWWEMKTLQLDHEVLLLSMYPRTRWSFKASHFTKAIRHFFAMCPAPMQVMATPSLEIFRYSLSRSTQQVYIDNLYQTLSSWVTILASRPKLYAGLGSPLLSALHFYPAPACVQATALQAVSARLESLGRKRPTKADRRAIDLGMKIAFDFANRDSLQSVGNIVRMLLRRFPHTQRHFPRFCDSLRDSYAKASALASNCPEVISIAASTKTENARSLLAIFRVLQVRGHQSTTSPLYALSCARLVTKLPRRALWRLCSDLRRFSCTGIDAQEEIGNEVLPRLHYAPREPKTLLIEHLLTFVRGRTALEDAIRPLFATRRTPDSVVACIRILLYCGCLARSDFNSLIAKGRSLGLDEQDIANLKALLGDRTDFDRQLAARFASCGNPIGNPMSLGELPLGSNCPSASDPGKGQESSGESRLEAAEAVERLAEAPHREIDRMVVKTCSKLVSVVMTTKNPQRDLLVHAIRSVLYANDCRLEMVIVDDASNPECSSMISEVIASFLVETPNAIKLLRNTHSIGQYASRNAALAHAHGDFVAFQDDDDFSLPHRLDAQVSHLLQFKSVKVCLTKQIRVGSDRCPQYDDSDPRTVASDSPISMVVRRPVFEQVGHFALTRTRGDIEFLQRVSQHYGRSAIATIDRPFVLMRGGSNTVSSLFEYNSKSALNAFRDVMPLEQHVLGNSAAVPTTLRAS